MSKICYIFAAGDFEGSFTPKENSLIIAADAGYRHAERLSVTPDILLGDFDTIGEMPDFSDVITFNSEKDYTDTELAIMEGIKRDCCEFIILGALGGKRLEHTIGNLALAASYAEKGYSVTLTDGNYIAKALHNDSFSLSGENTGFISLFCTSGKAEGVSISGLKYSLSDAVLDSSNPTLCISNEFCGKDAMISVTKGTIIIIWQKSKK